MSSLSNRNIITFFAIFLLLVLFKAEFATAQGINIDFGGGDDENTLFSNKVIQFIGLITILSVAPSILIMEHHLLKSLLYSLF